MNTQAGMYVTEGIKQYLVHHGKQVADSMAFKNTGKSCKLIVSVCLPEYYKLFASHSEVVQKDILKIMNSYPFTCVVEGGSLECSVEVENNHSIHTKGKTYNLDVLKSLYSM